MTTAGQVAIVMAMLALLAGGSLVGWIVLFRYAARADDGGAEGGDVRAQAGGHV